jgi:hypothetical protein
MKNIDGFSYLHYKSVTKTRAEWRELVGQYRRRVDAGTTYLHDLKTGWLVYEIYAVIAEAKAHAK